MPRVTHFKVGGGVDVSDAIRTRGVVRDFVCIGYFRISAFDRLAQGLEVDPVRGRFGSIMICRHALSLVREYIVMAWFQWQIL